MTSMDVGLPRATSATYQGRLRDLLALLGMDVHFHRGSGAHLFYHDQNGTEIQVLDLVGGFGATLLGHAHGNVRQAADAFLAAQEPFFAQASAGVASEQLARTLAARCGGNYRVAFASSGSEAVELAMRHALVQTGGKRFVALYGAFHGRTLGASQLTDPDNHAPLAAGALPIERVPVDDVETLARVFARHTDLAGMFVEPIQGEGGVRPLSASFLQAAARHCTAHGVPLIADECQTGVGRTGRFLATTDLGVRPDYVVLSKALGGGLAKTAAVLISQEQYQDATELASTSTFAGDTFSSRIALATLNTLDDDQLARVRRMGALGRRQLTALASVFPDCLAEVRGRGLMLGVQFQPQQHSPSFLLRTLSARGELARLVAAFLFHRHRIRVAPTLSDPWTLRLQPPVGIGQEGWEQLVRGLREACERLRRGDAMGLLDFALTTSPPAPQIPLARTTTTPTFSGAPAAGLCAGRSTRRVAWLCHMVDAEDFLQQEPARSSLGYEMAEQFLDRWSALAAPVVMNAVDVESRQGARVCLIPILLPVTTRTMKGWLDTKNTLGAELVLQGLHVAESLGCQSAALGQFTSIVTASGVRLRGKTGLALSSGNSYAVALARDAILAQLEAHDRSPRELVLGVAGGLGNIGRTCAEILAPQFKQTVLLGRAHAGEALRAQASALPNCHAATDPRALRGADVVVSATNAAEPCLEEEHLARGALVCDLAVPASVARTTCRARDDLTILRGGIARLPQRQLDLGIASFPLPRGHTFACMAEGLLLAFAGQANDAFTGKLTPAHIARVTELAQRHGFELAPGMGQRLYQSIGREPHHAHH